METMKEIAHYIATTRQGDKEKVITELLFGVSKQIYEANILQNAHSKYVEIKISPP